MNSSVSSISNVHVDFAAALFAPTGGCPPGLKAWNGSDPAQRFSVYRNNVMVSLIDALADSYPVVQALVGDAFFRTMAREFVRVHPPQSPVLAWYGAAFAQFIAHFAPASTLAYLPDMARLEWLRVESWHAADACAVSETALSSLLADETSLARTRFILHPATRWLFSAHPVVSLWAAHQSETPDAALAHIDMTCAQTAFLVRPDVIGVEIIPIETDAGHFLERLHSGMTLAEAAALGQFDRIAALAMLIRTRSIVGLVSTEFPPSIP